MSAELKGPSDTLSLSLPLTKVGRAGENQLILDDTEVSWLHAQIRQEGEQHSVVDLDSTNGTFVNGQKLVPHRPQPLQAGDMLRFGKSTYTYINELSRHMPTEVAPPEYIPPASPRPVAPPPPPPRAYATPPPFTPVPSTLPGPEFSPGATPLGHAAPASFQRQAMPSPPAPIPSRKEKTKDTEESGTPRWVVVAGGLASLASVLGLIWGIYVYMHPTPSPTPSGPTGGTTIVATPTSGPAFPHLHAPYSGSAMNTVGNTASFTISSLTEDDTTGTFTAEGTDEGTDGQCTTSYQGQIQTNGSITFTLTEAATSQGCGWVVLFTGKQLANGQFEGNWQGQGIFSSSKGSWTMQ